MFEEVAEVARAMAPPELPPFRSRAHRAGAKVWFGGTEAPREHYEAQLLPLALVSGARVVALEIGFHAEHPKVADNDAVLARLLRSEKRWRRTLGREAVAGPFLGRPDVWRRVSEVWTDPDLDDGALVEEIAARLTDYARVLEPARRDR